ncbi:MAG: FkbM family methyltransferase [Xenococcaceae cyanobacterium MO_207.B15]|nr:FkbM family methyltransferase [Xenococcaceae cyanobacterium MO_207.B15]
MLEVNRTKLQQMVGQKGSVIAFEPEPKNYTLLTSNIRLNKLNNVSAYQLALMDSKGKIELEISESNYGDHRIKFTNSLAPANETLAESDRKSISVSACTLD